MGSENFFESSPEMENFLCDRLLDQNQPISERFRALFSLRNLRGPAPRHALMIEGGPQKVIKNITFECLSNIIMVMEVYVQGSSRTLCFPLPATRDSSNLLAHEAAFALGQMQDAEAIPVLLEILKDFTLHPIVRHEAAEALGAVGLEDIIPQLEQSLVSDPAKEVRETCELALRRIEQQKTNSNGNGASPVEASPFLSVDPAMPTSHCSSVDQLRDILLNEKEGMYERYAALFALRNHGDEAAVSAIVTSLGARSALLRHEVAYVLGQLQNKTATSALSDILRNENEHPMVRHEAAEALGSIADGDSVALLNEFAKDPEPIVCQSCEVALSMLEFERSGKSFEYLFLQTPQVQ